MCRAVLSTCILIQKIIIEATCARMYVRLLKQATFTLNFAGILFHWEVCDFVWYLWQWMYKTHGRLGWYYVRIGFAALKCIYSTYIIDTPLSQLKVALVTGSLFSGWLVPVLDGKETKRNMELGESSWIKAPVKEVRTVRYRRRTFVSALYKLDLGV